MTPPQGQILKPRQTGRMMRLRFAFVAVTIAATMVFAEEVLDESKAIEKIELLGGKVTRDDTLPGRPVNGVDFRQSAPGANKRFNEKYLHVLKSFSSLTTLDLTNSSITVDGLNEIKGLKSLKRLALGGNEITDVGLKELSELKNLTLLDLCEPLLNDQGQMRRVELGDLRLASGKKTFTSDGIKDLKDTLPKLEIRSRIEAICQPDRIALGTIHVGAIVEASVRIYICGEETSGIKVTASPPPFLKVKQTQLGTQDFGNLGTFIYCDVFVALNTKQPGEFNGSLKVDVGDKQVEIPATVNIREKDLSSARVLIVETPFQRFATDDASLFDPWHKIVTSAHLDVSYLEVDRESSVLRGLSLSDFDVVRLGGSGLFLARDEDFEKLTSFVAAGGRVIIAANFFFRGTVDKANKFVVPLGLKMTDIDGPLIEVNESDISEHKLTEGVKKLKFFRPSPVSVEDVTKGSLLVKTEQFPQQGLVAVTKGGKGDVVVLGASLWWNWIASQQESGADNSRLLQNLLSTTRHVQ